ncbi:DUF4019 domain-containing protein [Verrucomicrobiota bacterium sgz303538]
MITKYYMIAIALLAAMVGTVGQLRAEETPEQLAQAAAEQWLELIDNGKFGESWQSAATYFKTAVPEAQWKASIEAARKPLGKVVSRKLKGAKYTKTLPGAPDGEYVVLQYDTSFANKQEAVETITPMLDKDGKWRVSGYFIK